MKKILLSALIFTLSFPMLSCAASFDCTKASSATEKLICGDEKISALDEKMAASYKYGLEKATDKDALKKQQIEWLRHQRACKNAACLEKTYQSRINELNNNIVEKNSNASSASAALTPKSIDTFKAPLTFKLVYGDSYPICQPYVDMLNAAKYREYPACERKILPELPQFKAIQWTEITERTEVMQILQEVNNIEDEMDKKINTNYPANRWANTQKRIAAGEVKLYFYNFDFDGDKNMEIIYKEMWTRKFNDCGSHDFFHVYDKKITIDNAQSFWPGLLSHFKIDGHNELFLLNKEIYSSNWSGLIKPYDISVYDTKAGTLPVCGINIQ